MGQNDFINSAMGSAFFQADPTVAFAFLTCAGVGDIAIPKGDSTPVYKPDPTRSGKMKLWTSIPGTAGMVTLKVTKPFNNVYNFLMEQDCNFNLRLNHLLCESTRDIVSNYSVAQLLLDCRIKTAGKTAPVLGGGTDAIGKQIDTTGDIEAMADVLVYPLKSAPLVLASTTDVLALAVVPEQCKTGCSVALGLGQIVYALNETTLYSGLQKTVDYGALWNAIVDTPFNISGNDASSGLVLKTATGYRLLVCGNLPDPLMPPEVSYLDVTVPLDPTDSVPASLVWVNIYVGAETNIGLNMLKRAANGRIWAVGTGGHVYYSDTLGQSWVGPVGSGTTQDLNDLVFLDDRQGFAVGDSNAFIYTTDGLTWNAGIGPAAAINLLSIDANRFGYLFVTTNDARIFRSVDGGGTWAVVLNLTVGSIDRVRFDPEYLYVGYAIYNTATPLGHLYRSEDGGVTWTEWASPAAGNAGYNDVAVCDPNLVYVGGNAMGGLSYVAKWDRSAA